LPALDPARPELQAAFVAPRSAMEATLAEIWSKTLGVEQVGVHDNFFDLGGDSILSMQIIARANQEGIRLMLKQLFQHQTIAELAGVATRAVTQAEPEASPDEAPLTPIQHWFFEQELVDSHHYTQFFSLEARAALDDVLLR